MSTTLLLTGASGFLGRHVLPLVASDPDRIVHAVASNPVDGFQDSPNVHFHTVDLLDPVATQSFLEEIKPDQVLHLAWFNGESASRYADGRNFDWVIATEQLVEQAAKQGAQRIVIAGSCIEYGPAGGVLSEDSPAEPDTIYGRCKLDAGLRTLDAIASHDGVTGAVARVFFVLGRHEEAARLVPTVARQLIQGDPAELSSGEQRRDYMHADDVARGLIALLQSDLSGHVNIGMGTPVAVRELAEMVGDAIGKPELLWFGARPGGADVAEEITADISKLRDATGWEPQLALPEAVADVVAWWREELGIQD